MSVDRPITRYLAVGCWILALLFIMFGVYCWVQDPFYQGTAAAQGLGSIFSIFAGCGGVGMGLCIGIVGLILTRRFLLLLGLVNLAMLIAAAGCAGSDIAPDVVQSSRWAIVFSLLAVSAVISVAMFALWRGRLANTPVETDRQ